MFHVGQKVVCVDDTPDHKEPNWKPLVRGKIYTISEFVNGYDDIEPGVTVAEVKMLKDSDVFYARRFRPIQERKTDIGIFTEMLTPVKEKEPA